MTRFPAFRFPALGLLCALSIALLAGCGSKTPAVEHPKTVPVTGTVTYKGAPVEGAAVVFKPESSQERGAVGTTDSEGHFKLMTYEPNDGAIPGLFLVEISKTEVPKTELTDNSLAETPPVKELLPVKFKSIKTSKLSADVKDSGTNDFTFALTD
jgi:hypothetical protein